MVALDVALGDLAPCKALDRLVTLLVEAPTASDRGDAERAVAAVIAGAHLGMEWQDIQKGLTGGIVTALPAILILIVVGLLMLLSRRTAFCVVLRT